MAHILQVAYDEGLLATRALLLKSRGHEVTSVRGNEQAMGLDGGKLAKFDAALVGFSAAYALRAAILDWLKISAPQLPVVVLQANSFELFAKADIVSLADPELWLDALASVSTRR